ncbi:MAG: phosphate signaling complex protein PhoU [Kiritimatiellae bacterium]|nr:phosphate signaling complex protein PhoU [Kiritimatiellia bacterium]
MSVHLERETGRLKQRILDMCARTERAVQEAVQSLAERDVDRAARLVDEDDVLDRCEVEIEEECLKVLALYQPVATDLRFIIAVMRLSGDLERIGDLAVHIAERVIEICREPPVGPPLDFRPLASRTLAMLHQSIDALIELDGAKATAVIRSDDEVDAENRALVDQIKARIRARPEQLDVDLNLMGIARHFERIADHAVSIAEDVLYLLEGRIVRHSKLGGADSGGA